MTWDGSLVDTELVASIDTYPELSVEAKNLFKVLFFRKQKYLRKIGEKYWRPRE